MWPPNYSEVFSNRISMMQKIEDDPDLLEILKAHYKNNPVDFINDWCITYNPRADLKTMPFILFPKQVELVEFLHDCLLNGENGLVEKARDMGATWVCVVFSVWAWLFIPGSSIGWGSRKADLVDRLGDPDSIFEKIRLSLDKLPRFLMPEGFNPKEHMNFMKVINPETNATIKGESGDNIGRGGRSLMYFKDEALILTSNVLTIGGWKSIGELKISDKVIDINGQQQKITHINDCGEFEIYKVGFNDGSFVECSPNHLWTLTEVIGKRKATTIRTKELYERYKYTAPNGTIKYRFRLPLIKPVEFKPVELPLHPYVVGALIGDGGVSQVPKNSPKLTSIDLEIVEYFTECLPEYCTITKEKNGISYRLGDVQGRMGWKYKSRIRQIIVDIGLAGKRSWEKNIPDVYKFSSVENRIELLNGLMDTDGSAGKSGGSAAYYTSSKQLADDVRFLAESLGGYATMKIKKDKRGFRDQYVLFVILPENIKPFRLARKLDLFGKRSQRIERSITSVEKTGKIEEVRCITVDSKDGLYLTKNCIPTHNSAHYERPELIEAALGDNTEVQIDISSVMGTANIFYRRRQAGEIWTRNHNIATGKTRIMILDWRDHPAKTQEWYDRRRTKFESEGLLHVFAQEVDRDYSSAVVGVVIPPAHVKAAIDAHKKLGLNIEGLKFAGLDVADEEGIDKNALARRHSILLEHCEDWAGLDTTATAKHAVGLCSEYGADELYYDCIGVGAGVRGETNSLKEKGHMPEKMSVHPWNAGLSGKAMVDAERRVIASDPKSPLVKDFYANMKAQAWWALRLRFEKTYKAVTQGAEYDPDDLISIDSGIPALHQLCNELSQSTWKKSDATGKILINKQPPGTRSPNLADSVVQCYFPPVKKTVFRIM